MPTEFRTLIRRAGGVGVLRVIAGGFGFVTTVTLARLLGHQEYGYYALAIAWAGFLSEPVMQGLGRLLVRAMATYEVKGEWGLIRGILLRLNQLVVAGSLVIAGAGCTVAFLWLSPNLRGPFCVAMCLILFTGLTVLREGAMQALGYVVAGQVPEFLIRPILLLVGVASLALVGNGDLTAVTAVAVNAASVAAAYLFGALQLRRALPRAVHNARTIFATREWASAAIPMTLITAAWNINTYIGLLIVGSLTGAPAAGVLNVSQKGVSMIALVLMAANISLAPEIVRLHALGDRVRLERAVEHIARVVVLVSLPLTVGLAVLPSVYLGLFGEGFSSGATATTILALAQLVNAALGPAGNVLMMTGHEKVALGGVVAGLIVNVVLGFALVPSFGVTGAAIASAVSMVVWNVALVFLVRRRVGINATSFRWASLARHQIKSGAATG